MAAVDAEEEEMVHNGEVLPILSASAKNMKIDRLLNAPLPTYDSSVPALIFGPKLRFGCVGGSPVFNSEQHRPAPLLHSPKAALAPCVVDGIRTA